MKINEQNKNVLVVGRAGMDLYAEPAGTPIEKAVKFSSQLGGSAANIAAGLSIQGLNVDLLSGISGDAIGKFVLNSCKKLGIGIHLLEIIPKVHNTLAVVDSVGEDTQAVIYRNKPADLFLDYEAVNRVNLNSYQFLIITGTALTKQPSRTAILDLMKRGRENGIEIICDIDYRDFTWESKELAEEVLSRAVDYSNVLIGNEVEFDFMSKKKNGGMTLAADFSKIGKRLSIYKMGANGLYYFLNQKKSFVNSFKVNAIKPTGAGDGFLAGFCSSLIKGDSLENAILFGSAVGAIVVTRVGCSEAMPDEQQVEKFMENFKDS